jgi:vacuolar-type H+-ATPase subunit H
MARSAVRKIEEPPRRKLMDVIIFAGIAIIVLFALVGLVSAGTYLGGKLSGGTKPSHSAGTNTAKSGGSHELAAAQVQATQIVRAARAAGHTIIVSATTRANLRARTIVKNAQETAARTRAAAASAASNSASSTGSSTSTSSSPTTGTGSTAGTTTGATSGSTGTAASGTSNYSSSAGVSSSAPTTSVETYATPVPTASLAPVSSAPVNLSGVPATWKVVAYNATFGSGPGSAGSITVTNRSTRPFSGTAQVSYTGGGTATASFAALAPGQTIVLPLNGTAYPGRGFNIQVLGVH